VVLVVGCVQRQMPFAFVVVGCVQRRMPFASVVVYAVADALIPLSFRFVMRQTPTYQPYSLPMVQTLISLPFAMVALRAVQTLKYLAFVMPVD
jgi:hypothetical protein